MLDATVVVRREPLGEPDVAGAVRAILVPVINALSFSERRAHELLRRGPDASRSARAKKRRARRRRNTRAT
ncbi:MAG: hypothetical protein QM750_11670 [Rubrivivax sp.]